MSTIQMLLLVYAISLMADMVIIIAFVMLVTRRPHILGHSRTHRLNRRGMDGGRVGELMEELCEKAKTRWRPMKAITDGTRLIVVMGRSTAATVRIETGEDGTRVECSPRRLHFARYALMLMLLSFMLGPVALILVLLAVRSNRRFNDELFEYAKSELRPTGKGRGLPSGRDRGDPGPVSTRKRKGKVQFKNKE